MGEEHIKEMAEMRATVTTLTEDIAEIKTSMKGLLDAWNAASALVTFVRVLAMIGGGVAAVLGALKFGVHK